MSINFIFLEFLDPEINALINGLRKEFGDSDKDSRIHITVRGPYSDTVDADLLVSLKKEMGGEPILIHSAGIFRNKEYSVYLKIESEHLRKIWWKPDFPIEKYGFNPHITLYIGNDKELAECAYNFLKSENIKVLCYDYTLTAYTSKQQELFPNEDVPEGNKFLELTNRRIVRADILQRANNAVRNCRATCSNK